MAMASFRPSPLPCMGTSTLLSSSSPSPPSTFSSFFPLLSNPTPLLTPPPPSLHSPARGNKRETRGTLLGRAQSGPNKDGGSSETDEENLEKTASFIIWEDFWLAFAVAVFDLGFIDAGYSGDWSRIGVLSKETESTLRMAAYVVVPVSTALAWFTSQRRITK